jgi:hypothetical protein
MTSYSSRERVLILSESLILIVIAITIFSTPAASGYEITIYDAFPLYFFVLVFVSFMIGFALILNQGLLTRGGSWKIGFGITLLSSMIFLSLPVIRGYHLFLSADAMFHAGQIKHILHTNHVPEDLIYPALHILVSSSSIVTGRAAVQMLYLMAVPFAVMSAGFAYLVARGLDYNSKTQIFVFLLFLMGALPGSLNTSPFSLSTSFIILVLYLAFRIGQTERYAYKSILAIVLISLVIFHILSLAYSIVMIGLIYLFSRSTSIDVQDYIRQGPRRTTYLLAGSSIAAYSWLSQEVGFKLASTLIIVSPFASRPDRGRLSEGETRSVTEFASQLPDFLEGTVIGQYLSVIVQNTPALSDLIRVFVFTYGGLALSALGVAIVTTYYYLYDRHRRPYFRVFFVIYVFSMLTRVAGMALNSWSTTLRRFSVVGGIFSTIIIALGTIDIKNSRINGNKIISTFLVLLILSSFSISFISTYNSPMNSNPNFQMAEMQVSGGGWLIEHSEDEANFQEWGFDIRRYSQFRADQPTMRGSAPVDHFGYDEREHYATYKNESGYLSITSEGKMTYPELHPNYPDRWRYRPNDFSRLQSDHTINSVYTNGEFIIYRHD